MAKATTNAHRVAIDLRGDFMLLEITNSTRTGQAPRHIFMPHGMHRQAYQVEPARNDCIADIVVECPCSDEIDASARVARGT